MASFCTTFGGLWVNSQTGEGISLVSSDKEEGFRTLAEYAGKGGANVGDDLVVLFGHLEYACKRIAALVASPCNSTLGQASNLQVAVGRAEINQSHSILCRMRLSRLLYVNLEKLQLWLQKRMTLQFVGLLLTLHRVLFVRLLFCIIRMKKF